MRLPVNVPVRGPGSLAVLPATQEADCAGSLQPRLSPSLPPSLPCSFSAVWVSRDYEKPWLLGKSDTAWLILPHKELQHLEVLLQSGVESIFYNLVHSNKYFTFLIWNRNTRCKNIQPQMKCFLMWMYTSLQDWIFSYFLLCTNTPLKLISTNVFYYTYIFGFVMEQVKVKIDYILHILIWSWRYLNNLYFVMHNFVYSQRAVIHTWHTNGKKELHFSLHYAYIYVFTQTDTHTHLIFAF